MPRKPIAYRLISQYNSRTFNDKVNDAIGEGFEPHGDMKIIQPVAVTDHASKDLYSDEACFCQAMVMYSDYKCEL